MKYFLLIFACICALPTWAEEKNDEPRYAVTFNPLETAAFFAVNKLAIAKNEPDLIYWPFHFDGQMRVSDKMGVSFGLIYRYENYQDKGPLYSDSGNVRPKKIWTNYHELFLLAGPRFSFATTGLTGFYFAMKGGVGTAISSEYFALSLAAQPEIGYAFSFGNPGFRLELGLGVLANMPFYETVDFAVPWKATRLKLSAIGILVHQAIPILNVGVGVSW